MEEIDSDQAGHLKNLRLAAGLDHAQLAALSNLSVGQLRQLEEGGENLFYSPQIKSQSMRRVIRMLENPAPNTNPSKVYVDDAAPRASGNVIEDIIRLSETNLKGSFLSSPARHPDRSGYIVSGIVLIAVSMGAFSWWKSTQPTTVNVFAEWVEPQTAHREPSASSSEVALPSSNSSVQTTTQEVAIMAPAAHAEKTEIKPVTTPVAVEAKPSLVPTAPASTAKPVKANTETVALPAATTQSNATAASGAPAATANLPPSASSNATPIASLNASAVSAKDKPVAAKQEKNDCTSISSEAVGVKPYSASKPGNYIYVVASKPAQLCIDDGQKNHTVVNLEPGVGRSIHGTAPWTVSGHNLTSVQVYFQGSKVLLPSEATNRIYLKEQSQNP